MINKIIIRKKIRNKMKYIRNRLTPIDQYQSSKKIAYYIINDYRIKLAKKIGLFVSFNGEIKTNLLIKILLNAKKKIFLPVLNHSYKNLKQLLFSQYISSESLVLNKLKIYEPKSRQESFFITIQELDILFIPLVSFDNNGNRLGMGKGCYDYTLRNWKNNNQNFLIGLSYDCQYSEENLPTESWDIAPSEIITPSTHWIWKNKNLIRKIKI